MKKFFVKNYLSLALIIIFLIFFSWLHWTSFNSPWERDEGEYAYSAWLMRQGETPYLDSFVQKPPLIIYTYYLGQLIDPLALWPPRLLGFIFTLASCFLLSLIAKKIYGPKAAWLALWISPLLLTLPPIYALAANTEKFMLLPLIGLLALFIYRLNQEKSWTYFGAGVLSALAILYKPIALSPIILLLIYWLVQNWLVKRSSKQILVASGLIFFGAVLVTFLSLFYFLINGALGEIWQQVVVYNASYAVDMKRYFPDSFLYFLGVFWNNWWPIFLIILAAVIFRFKFFLLWLSLLLVSLLSVINAQVGHYYLLLMPFLVLLSAGAYATLSVKINFPSSEWRDAFLAILIISIIGISFCSIGEQFFLNSQELSTWIYGRTNPFAESALMADKIKQNTKIGERIFVGGSEPQLYYLSQRKSVSKFDITYPLVIETPWRLSYQKQVIKDLEQGLPAAIVLSLQPGSGLWNQSVPRLFIDYLLDDLKNNYRLVGGTMLTAVGKDIWVMPETVFNQADCSLLLYVRK